MELWKYIKEKMITYSSQKICEQSASLTYEEMLVAAESLGKTLKGQTCCAICCRSELFATMALLGCFSCGVTAVPLSLRYGKIHCNKILQSVSPSCVITDIDGKFGVYDILDSEYKVPEKQTSIIMYTSGTSGVPKGAMLGAESIITNIRDIISYFPIHQTDTILISRSLYHCSVLTGELLVALVTGAKIVFSSNQFNPKTLIKALKDSQITVFGGTPTLLETLSHFIQDPHSLSVKKVIVSGECLNVSAAKKIRQGFPNAEIHHVYGLTEACPRVSHLPAEFFDSFPDCVGVPLDSVNIKIQDDQGKIVPEGEVGTLWVQGKNIMHGYYNSPEQTKIALRNGWLCTGDIATITKEGFLKIKGRKDDLIIRAGMNIYPQEIEAELKKDPRTHEVLVQRIEKEIGGSQIAMKIVGTFEDVSEVRELCKKCLPIYQIPTKIEIVKSLPKNGTGKIIRRYENA